MVVAGYIGTPLVHGGGWIYWYSSSSWLEAFSPTCAGMFFFSAKGLFHIVIFRNVGT